MRSVRGLHLKGVLCLILCFHAGAQAQEQGILHFLAGDVKLDGRKAVLGTVVRQGATIETGQASVAEIRFGHHTGLRVREQTRVKIDWPASAYRILLEHGALLSTVRHQADFEVQTPITTAGVRGTFFYVQVPNDTTTYVCTCNGTVELREGGKVLRKVSVPHHEAWEVRGRPGSLSLRPQGMLGHTDLEIFEQRYRLEREE